MSYRDIFRTLSLFLFMMIIPLLLPLGIAIYCDWIKGPDFIPQRATAPAFLMTVGINAALALFFYLLGRKAEGRLYRREALLLVVLVWFLIPMIGSLPYFLSGTLKNPLDAYFETVSGYTTTGATILEAKNIDAETGRELPITKTYHVERNVAYTFYGNVDPILDPQSGKTILTGIEALSPALLFWRSLTEWLGGVGIVVLFVAVLPALGVGGKVLYQAEVTGPSKESLAPRIKETASQLWKIYLGLTLVQMILLMLTNKEMSPFDAVTISFATISTGGFAPKNGSIASYNNPATDWVVLVFMIFGSINFSLYFFCMRGKFNRLNDPELKLFLLIALVASLFAAWNLIGFEKFPMDIIQKGSGENYSVSEAIRYGAFQMVSTISSTGFSIANYNHWPFSIQTVMLILMFIGGMAGSTAGGLKVIRFEMFFRVMLNKIEQIFRPDTVRTYRIGTATIDQNVAITVLTFFMVAVSLTVLGTFVLILDGLDPVTSFTSIAGFLNNIGSGLEMAGPANSFAFLSNFGKILSSIWMIAGRLEYFALLIIFVPAFWRTR